MRPASRESRVSVHLGADLRVTSIRDGQMSVEHGARKVPVGRYLLFFAVAIGGCALDLATKSWIFAKLGMPDPEKQPIWIWNNVFSLTTSLNDGALFGIGKGFVAGFAVLSIIAAFFVLYWLFYAG